MRYKFSLLLLAALFASASCGAENGDNDNKNDTPPGPNGNEAAVKAALKKANEAEIEKFLNSNPKELVIGSYAQYNQFNELKEVNASIREVWENLPDNATLGRYTEGWPLDAIDTKEVTKALVVLFKMYSPVLALKRILAYENRYSATLNQRLTQKKITSFDEIYNQELKQALGQALKESEKKEIESMLQLRKLGNGKINGNQTIRTFLEEVKKYIQNNMVSYASVRCIVKALEALKVNKSEQKRRDNKVETLLNKLGLQDIKDGFSVGVVPDVSRAISRGDKKGINSSAGLKTFGQYKELFSELPEDKLDECGRALHARIEALHAIEKFKGLSEYTKKSEQEELMSYDQAFTKIKSLIEGEWRAKIQSDQKISEVTKTIEEALKAGAIEDKNISEMLTSLEGILCAPDQQEEDSGSKKEHDSSIFRRFTSFLFTEQG